MYIPKQLITQRFYVAVRKTRALSSWRTLEEALNCIERFKDYAPYEFSTIKGVIKVSDAGREWVETAILEELLKEK